MKKKHDLKQKELAATSTGTARDLDKQLLAVKKLWTASEAAGLAQRLRALAILAKLCAEAAYGDYGAERASEVLGLAKSTVYRHIKVFTVFGPKEIKQRIASGLLWVHLETVVSLQDGRRRAALLDEVLAKRLSSRELQVLVAHEGGEERDGPGHRAAETTFPVEIRPVRTPEAAREVMVISAGDDDQSRVGTHFAPLEVGAAPLVRVGASTPSIQVLPPERDGMVRLTFERARALRDGTALLSGAVYEPEAHLLRKARHLIVEALCRRRQRSRVAAVAHDLAEDERSSNSRWME